MRLVLDTNILVSALFWSGNERKILRACVDGSHRSVTSPIILAEAERVLIEKFEYSKNDTAAFLGLVERASDVVTPDVRLAVVTDDPSDDRVIECAVAGKADRIVTGDRHLLKLGSFRRIAILRAADALR